MTNEGEAQAGCSLGGGGARARLCTAVPAIRPTQVDGERDLERVDLLNENSAVTAPHMKLGRRRGRQISLFSRKWSAGSRSRAEESATYRVLYQSILKDKQSELKLLDHQLTVVTNFRLEEKNNVGTFGIEGSHDHHDASAAENLSALRRRSRAAGAGEWSDRILRARACRYQRLQESHRHHCCTWGRRRRPSPCPMSPRRRRMNFKQQFEAMMVHYKRAQFEPVNSPAYVTEVHLALDSYDALVAMCRTASTVIWGRWNEASADDGAAGDRSDPRSAGFRQTESPARRARNSQFLLARSFPSCRSRGCG